MRNFTILLTGMAILCLAGTVAAQDSLDYINPPTGSITDGGTTVVLTGTPVTFTIHQWVGAHDLLYQSNGFEVYLSDQADGGTYAEVPGIQLAEAEALVDFVGLRYYCWGFSPYIYDGVAADTIGIVLMGYIDCEGLPAGFEEDVFTITTGLDPALGDAGYYLCIDSAFYPPNGAWLWSNLGGEWFPGWGGQRCYEIVSPCHYVGDIDLSGGNPSVSDLTLLVAFLFQSEPLLVPEVADFNGDGQVNISDLTYFVDFFFQGVPPPVGC